MEDWRKYANTIMLSIITIVVTAGAGMLNNTFGNMNDKLDSIIITAAINSERISAHNIEADVWKGRIEKLETGQHKATNDRITKTEALAAIDVLEAKSNKMYEDLRKYTERNFMRK